MELPLTNRAGVTHAFIDDSRFNVAEGQSGNVWFLAAPFGTVQRSCTIPAAKALFFALLTAEASNLEGLGNTAAEQRANAKATADAIVVSSLACTIDGVPVNNLGSYRAVSPQFNFFAPTPWVFGEIGGRGKSVGDGYYLMLAPFAPGSHTLHFGGKFHFDDGTEFSLDMTYYLTVQPRLPGQRDDCGDDEDDN